MSVTVTDILRLLPVSPLETTVCTGTGMSILPMETYVSMHSTVVLSRGPKTYVRTDHLHDAPSTVL
jgi:hypothetical protein